MGAHLPVFARSSARLGFWASLGAAITFVVFALCFLGLAIGRPLFIWTGLSDYIAYLQTYPSPLADIARLSMLVFAVLFVILLNSIYDTAAAEHKSASRLALYFGVGFAVLTSAHYFVQLSAVRVSIAQGTLAGLEQVVQANPYAAIAAINMLGWTVFLGVASLFAARAFSGAGTNRVLRYAFLANGAICLAGAIGYVTENAVLVFITMNPLMGGALLVITIAACVYFRQVMTAPVSAKNA